MNMILKHVIMIKEASKTAKAEISILSFYLKAV